MAKKNTFNKNIVNERYNSLIINLNKDISNDLKIKMIEDFCSDLLDNYNKGKKIFIKINNEKVYISKNIVSMYRNVYRLLDKYKNKEVICEKKEPVKDIYFDHNMYLYNNLVNKLTYLSPAINRSPSLSEQYSYIKEVLKKDNVSIIDKNKMMRDFINQNIIIINFLNGKVRPNSEEIEMIDDVVFDDLQGYRNYENDVKKEEKVISIDRSRKEEKLKRIKPKKRKTEKIKQKKTSKEIIKSEKKDNKNKNKKTRGILKRVGAGVAAAVVLLFGSLIANGGGKKPTSNDSKTSSSTISDTTRRVNKSSSNSTKVKQNNNFSTVKKMTSRATSKVDKKSSIKHTKKTKVKSKKISVKSSVFKYLGAKIKLKKNSKIYSNINNSINKSNGYDSYYSYKTLRNIVGCGVKYKSRDILFLEVGKDSYQIYDNDKTENVSYDEAQSRLSSIIKDGGKIQAVASRRDSTSSGIEGFYNYDDVKVLRK